jgi:SNF2 family DNA or RNA helicase
MLFLQRFRLGGCLADDMGLGKTVQVLALLSLRKLVMVGRPSLVVVPRSLIFNWQEEAARFAPQLKGIDASHGQRGDWADLDPDADFVLITYGTLVRDITSLKDIAFDYVILDEAQAIKNHQTARAKAVRLLKASHRLALSGTPIENRIEELWSIFEFLNPGFLGHSSTFKKLFAADLEDENQRAALRNAIAPFILRRSKTQVALDLPPRTEDVLLCEMEARQQALYNKLRDHYRQSLLKKVQTEGMNRVQTQVLEALLRLRQAACHPKLIDPKLLTEDSVKLDTLIDQLDEIVGEGHKALIFSQFTSFLALVKPRIEERGWAYEYLDGKTRNRQERVERFQSDPHCPLFLISLKAGGLGLNLVAADYVFLLDPWWNPAVEAQAIDRTHRIGQERPVFAYRLICRDTVEEKILQLQKSKKSLADSIIAESSGMLKEMSADDLAFLLG